MKLKYDPKREAFTISRPLVLGLSYASDWGLVPGTSAPDGDPLDAMVLMDAVALENKEIELLGWGGPPDALRLIEHSRRT